MAFLYNVPSVRIKLRKITGKADIGYGYKVYGSASSS